MCILIIVISGCCGVCCIPSERPITVDPPTSTDILDKEYRIDGNTYFANAVPLIDSVSIDKMYDYMGTGIFATIETILPDTVLLSCSDGYILEIHTDVTKPNSIYLKCTEIVKPPVIRVNQ